MYVYIYIIYIYIYICIYILSVYTSPKYVTQLASEIYPPPPLTVYTFPVTLFSCFQAFF